MNPKLWCTAVLSAALAASSAIAQDAPPSDFKTYRPSTAALKITADEAPLIDGELNDAVWQRATAITAFFQLEPDEGQPSSERTVAYVAYDEENLYVAFYCYDSDPSGILAKIKARDGALGRGDLVRLYLDPNMTRRDGYVFEVNGLGARTDGLVENNSRVLYEWNTLWSAGGKVHADGWSVEMAIPFRSVSFDPNATEWGFDLFRIVRRKNERIRWSSVDISIPSHDISRSGTLTGLTGMDQGLGLDIQAYGAARYVWDHTGGGDGGFEFNPSGNVFYKVTSSLTGTLTVNTDFSDTPLDERQVNTGRFGLFFPETRDFFLQDAGSFEFGGVAMGGNQNGRPFFSRRVGLVNGEPVPLAAGLKFSGSHNGYGIGALSVLTGPVNGKAQVLSAARLTAPIFEESKIGIIATHGDPRGADNNTVAGADIQYLARDVLGVRMQADAFFLQSFSTLNGRDSHFGAAVNFPDEPLRFFLRFRQVGANFAPALGFANRTGIRSLTSEMVFRRRFDDGPLRWAETGLTGAVTTNLDGHVEDYFLGAWVGTFTRDGWIFFANVFQNYEEVPAAFDLPQGVTVPAGNYLTHSASFHVETPTGRPLVMSIDFEAGGFLSGTYRAMSVFATWIPDDTFEFEFSYRMNDIKLPTGEVDIQILGLNGTMNFTPDMQLRMQAQWDNISQAFGLSLRYRWEYEPGAELFVAAGESGVTEGRKYISQATQASVRIGHTFRY